jgi:hypothetical protein
MVSLILGMQPSQVKNLSSKACNIQIRLILSFNMRLKKTWSFASIRKIIVFLQQVISTSKIMLNQAAI